MNEEDKIKLISYLKEHKSEEEIIKLEQALFDSKESHELLKEYAEMIKQIDLIYARKMIKKELKELHFKEDLVADIASLKMENKAMNTKPNQWIQYPIMILIAAVVSWIVFSIAFKEEDDQKANQEIENDKIEATKEVPIDNKITMDKVNTGIDVMGIALNTTGYYLLPYSVNELNAVFGSTGKMTNNLPLTIIWDDKAMGLAVAAFADENLEKLPTLPYSFSKDDFFLGEEMFLVFSSRSKVSINSGIIIEDSPDSATMQIHLSLKGNVYGATVIDNSGLIVGICERQDEDGNATVIKSKEIYKMISEMNLDKGVPYIALPKNNYLRSKQNSERVEMLSNHVAWFNSKN
jgi:hypothetical protein